MRHLLALLVLLSIAPGCERDFPAPEPAVQVTGLSVFEGFLDDRVVIQGQNFAPGLGDNLVTFGTALAAVEEVSPGEIAVRVPELEIGAEVYVAISTPTGQGSSEQPFRYLGPGHPLDEWRSRLIRLETALATNGPSSPDPPPGRPAPRPGSAPRACRPPRRRSGPRESLPRPAGRSSR